MYQGSSHEVLEFASRAARVHSQMVKGAQRDITTAVSDAGVVHGGIARILTAVSQFLAFAWIRPASRAFSRQSDLLSFLGIFSQRVALSHAVEAEPIFPYV